MKRKLVFVGLVFFASLALLQYHSLSRLNKSLNPLDLQDVKQSALVKPVQYSKMEVGDVYVISVNGEKFVSPKPSGKSSS